MNASHDELFHELQSLRETVAPPQLVEQFPAVAELNGAEFIEIYRHLGPDHPAAQALLGVLGYAGGHDHLAALAELLATNPPGDGVAAAAALVPLFHRADYDPGFLFPRLLDAIREPRLAAAVIDLANRLAATGRVPVHPAADRRSQLIFLLGEIAQRLGHLGDAPPETTEDLHRTRQAAADGVSLAVALCHALVLLNEREAIGKLYQLLAAPHRRLQTEAAWALAHFGEEEGKKRLASLAADPACRLRALAYAEELGLLDTIEPQFTTPAARAEGELVAYLAEPTSFGVAPQECELFDSRELYWPGDEEPTECFLFRYGYHLSQGSFENIGIAGPLVRTVTANLLDLPANDIYALFAGWQAEHEEILEIPIMHLSETSRIEVARLERRLHDAGMTHIEPLWLGYFFGEKVLVARARQGGRAGTAVADSETHLWQTSEGRSPLDAQLVYCIYKGRKLLRSFNE